MSNDESLNINLAIRCHAADKLHIFDQILVTAENLVQRIAPQVPSFVIRVKHGAFRNKILTAMLPFSVQPFADIESK